MLRRSESEQAAVDAHHAQTKRDAHYVDEFDKIANADDQIDQLQAIVHELYEESQKQPSVLTGPVIEAALHMCERSHECDGFGVLGTLVSVLECADESLLSPLLSASLARRTTWMTQELQGVLG